MNIKQQYCIVTQEEANEARELLVKAGEPISEHEEAFLVIENGINKLIFHRLTDWFVSSNIPKNSTQLTYPQFKEMLNAKIKDDVSIN